MDPRAFVFDALFPAIVGLTGCWTFVYMVRAIGKRIAGRDRDAASGASLAREDAARWQRLEQAVDAMAIEIERISEAQRFTAKLLSERHAGPPLPGSFRSPSSPSPIPTPR
jgi:hypothetical protein